MREVEVGAKVREVGAGEDRLEAMELEQYTVADSVMPVLDSPLQAMPHYNLDLANLSGSNMCNQLNSSRSDSQTHSTRSRCKPARESRCMDQMIKHELGSC